MAFFQAVKVILTKRDTTAQKKTDEQRDMAIRQIISQAVVSERVVDIFDAVGLDKPNIGLLDDAFLAQVKNLPERNLAVERLERLLEGEIKAKFATNVVQQRKFSDLLTGVIARYQNRSIETTQVMDELADETLKKIAYELTDNLRKNTTVDWSQRESVRASLRLMVKRILRTYKYPPDMEASAVELVLQQAQALGESWTESADRFGAM